MSGRWKNRQAMTKRKHSSHNLNDKTKSVAGRGSTPSLIRFLYLPSKTYIPSLLGPLKATLSSKLLAPNTWLYSQHLTFSLISQPAGLDHKQRCLASNPLTALAMWLCWVVCSLPVSVLCRNRDETCLLCSVLTPTGAKPHLYVVPKTPQNPSLLLRSLSSSLDTVSLAYVILATPVSLLLWNFPEPSAVCAQLAPSLAPSDVNVS